MAESLYDAVFGALGLLLQIFQSKDLSVSRSELADNGLLGIMVTISINREGPDADRYFTTAITSIVSVESIFLKFQKVIEVLTTPHSDEQMAQIQADTTTGNTVMVYAGDDESIVSALEQLMGKGLSVNQILGELMKARTNPQALQQLLLMLQKDDSTPPLQ